MQRLDDSSWVISASDLGAVAQCPWRLARVADQKLGKGISVVDLSDPMMELVAQLGLDHEQRTLVSLKAALSSVVEIPYERPPFGTGAEAWRDAIQRSLDATLGALNSDADALFQATLYQSQLSDTELPIGFQGFADFIVRQGDGWEIWDTKLARRAKDSALVQLCAYADQLQQLGILASGQARLILGDGSASVHELSPIRARFTDLRDSVVNIIAQREADPAAALWRDERYAACGTSGCGACQEAIHTHDDLFQIAGLRKSQRATLLSAGFQTMPELAAVSVEEVLRLAQGINKDTLSSLHLQATVQVESRSTPSTRPAWQLVSRSRIARLPLPNAGDLFFDFEGDPTYQEFDSTGEPLRDDEGFGPVRFGIEYLFGVWGENINPHGANPQFLPLWAENFVEEKATLEQFCALVAHRVEAYPEMHVYHYAPYERTKIRHLHARYNTASECVTRLLDHLLVDLYPVVTGSLKIGLPGYGLKALEALYFEPNTRTGIAGGGESVVAFTHYKAFTQEGNASQARELKASITDYNRLDCYSTKALRDWLLNVASQA
jgi:predicted RecB family nuclease